MLNIIQAEWMKTRHNRLFQISAALCLLFPALMALKDWKLNQAHAFGMDAQAWQSMTQDMGLTILLNVLSGLILTLSFQREYTERTIISQLTCPITRTRFLAGKLTVWAVWHMLLTLLLWLSTQLGVLLLYPGTISWTWLLHGALPFLAHGALVFLTLLPLAAAAVLQKGVFYPSLLLCLAFTGISSMSAVLLGILPFVLPWSAARLLGTMPLAGTYLAISAASVSCCACVGLLLSLIGFRRQNL